MVFGTVSNMGFLDVALEWPCEGTVIVFLADGIMKPNLRCLHEYLLAIFHTWGRYAKELHPI